MARTTSDDAATHFEWQQLIAAGSACEQTGDYGKAAEHYEAATKLAERPGAPRNRYLGLALLDLAWARSKCAGGDPDASYARAVAILEDNIDQPGIVHPIISRMTAWWTQQDPAGAERLGMHFLAIFERTLGILHEDTMTLIVSLGAPLWLQQKHAEAEQLYERTLQAAEAAWGRVDSRGIHVITRMLNQINQMARFRARDASEAESMYSRAVTLADRLPDGYDRTSFLALGTLYEKQGRYEKAEKLLRRCWSKETTDDTVVADALGAVLRKTGREKEDEEIEQAAQRLHGYLNP